MRIKQKHPKTHKNLLQKRQAIDVNGMLKANKWRERERVPLDVMSCAYSVTLNFKLSPQLSPPYFI